MPLFGKKSPKSNKNSKFFDQYTVGSIVGQGAFADVKLVTRKEDGLQFAAKIIDKSKVKGKEESLENEITILKHIKHPNIVSMIDFFQDDKRYMYLIMMLVTGGELFDRIIAKGFYTERDAVNILKQILSAVGYLHAEGIVHRDLKPENLLMLNKSEDSPVVLSDFGLSTYINRHDQMTVACGTPGYVAPEVLMQKLYDEKIDTWSIGVIAYILLSGFPPFYSENDTELFEQIKSGKFEYESPYWDEISANAKDLINKLLTVDPILRLSCKEAMEHRWMVPGTAADKNLASSVSENMRKYLTKMRWKRAFNAATAINRMKAMTLGENGAEGPAED